jgi:hypothetical protein
MNTFAKDFKYWHPFMPSGDELKPLLGPSEIVLAALSAMLAVITLSGCAGVASTKQQTAPAQGTLSASSTTLGFGSVSVGSTASLSVTITNTGSSAVTVSNSSISGSDFSLTSGGAPGSLSVGQSTTIQIQFKPQTTGNATGTLTVQSDASDSTLSVSLSGTGAVQSALSAIPASLSFGNVTVGSNSTQAVSLTNTGNSNVTISTVSVSGTGFSTSGVASGTVLSPTQSATLSVLYAPGAVGVSTGTVTVATTATNTSAAVALSGTGVTGSTGGADPTCGTSATIGPSGGSVAAPISGDTTGHAPPNYVTYVPPGIGQTWTDQNFGCTITRLTDAYNDGFDSSHSEHHYYVPNVLNQNDDRIIIVGQSGSTYILDTGGHRIVTSAAITNLANSTGSGIYWGRASGEQYTLYWKAYSGTTYSLRKADTTACTSSAPCSSLTVSTVYTSTCGAYNNNNEDDLRINSTSGDEYVGWDCNGAFSFLNITSATMGPTASFSSSGFDNYKIVRGPGSAMYMCVNTGSGGGSTYGNAGQGVWCFDQTGATVGQVTSAAQHANTVWDPSTSTSYWVQEQSGNDTSTHNACNGSPAATGIEAISITSPPVHTCIWEWPNWNIQGHISGSDLGIISYDTIFGTSVNPLLFDPYASMDTNWATDWGSEAFMGEVLIMSTSGGKIYRVANHRSRPNNGGSQDYWSTPRSSLSIDGHYVVFDSNQTHGCCSLSALVPNYSDVYMVRLQ